MEKIENEILSKVDEISQQMIASIQDIVKIKSVREESLPDAPFGKGPKQALDAVLALANELGFTTTNVDNYAGFASYGEINDEDYVGIMGHLDVVPEGTGWKHAPYSGYIEDDVIYSRGVLDNKGPILSCLFALYALKQLGIKLKHEVRIIFGCNEETGFADVKYYLSKHKPPKMGFTPDCKYPVVYGERGRAVVKISNKTANLQAFFNLVNTYILNAKNNGERLGIDFTDEEFGLLEVRNYQLLNDNKPAVQFSVSYPASCTPQQIIENIQNAVGCDYCVELIDNYNPVKFEKDCFLVKTLVDTYEKVTGNDGTPVTTTGGTYAKMMPNIVPFGPSFPGQKGIGHQPNEWMTVPDLITNAKIYALSIYQLAK
ncbi:Sapep family Mn(2+)-dependent dipeptidase [Ligilactobacillus sp. Marseille-Q7487]|uniref:Sapep family Mn(2+)-dependent dipeptidase n=1 Tax=Ligilactobacillus sp. Marseille-Q7487 TaxID=3022128 RepID=UPI0024A8DD27|nr:Sapep family Mn(2+)-dependent dipeptidase [Ligilactobacillus sp. Marseille-Q7487]